jgi:hypothetical protein
MSNSGQHPKIGYEAAACSSEGAPRSATAETSPLALQCGLAAPEPTGSGEEPVANLIGGSSYPSKATPDTTRSTSRSGPAALPPPTGPPAVRFGFSDEFSLGVSEFLRRTGIGRTHFYALLNANQVASYLDGSKRMVLIASWLAYVTRRQAAERAGQLGKRPGTAGSRGLKKSEAI